MLAKKLFKQLVAEGRTIEDAHTGDDLLGPFKNLPGTWSNLPNLPGRGWNMIALPFIAGNPVENLNYRLLMNQYNETLKFSTIDKGVPNRGINLFNTPPTNSDQFVVTLEYEQSVVQIASGDFPESGKAGLPGAAIHHEPGLFLFLTNNVSEDLSIARLGSVPHGNSVLAMGKVKTYAGAPKIPDVSGLPIGVEMDLDAPYLAPYKHYHDAPFENLFEPVHPNQLLIEANEGVDIVRTTELRYDTKFASGGVLNIPFVERQADATDMSATFWIQELAEKDENGDPKLRIQYSQTVFLDFFPKSSIEPGLIRWPHVSINTLEKISNDF